MSHLRIGVREEKHLGHPVADRGVGLFTPREQRTSKTQDEGDGQRANKEATTQVIRDVAEQQSQAFDHSFTFCDEISNGLFEVVQISPTA